MQAQDRTIERWFNRIRTGQLLLPRFQRYEAWPYENIAGLLDSVLKELPVGSALILQIGENRPFVTRPLAGAPEPTERCNEYLLDGQQRLTALWRSLHDSYDDQTFFVQLEEPAPDDDGAVPSRITRQNRWLRGDGRLAPLWADDPIQVYERGLAPVSLLQPSNAGQHRQQWCDTVAGGDLKKSREIENLLRDLQDKIKNFNLPILCLEIGTKPATALDVFVKLNTSGVPLSIFEIIVVQFEGRTSKSMHDLVLDLKKRSPAVESYISPEYFVLQTAALRSHRSPAQASFQMLDLGDLDNEWDKIAEGIQWAVEVMEEESVFDNQRLPTVVVLPVLAALYDYIPRKLDAHANARALVRAYVWRAFATSRYDNASSTRSLQDYRGLRATLQNKASRASIPIFNETDYPLPQIEELIQASWPKRKDTLARTVLAVSIKAGAYDIADGSKATRQRLGDREYHHLFPDSLLIGDGGLTGSESSRALNCALITMSTNRNVSAKEPLKYLTERIDRADLGEPVVRHRLMSHVVPFEELNVGGYANLTSTEARRDKIRADYNSFLEKRSALISSGLEALCAGRNWPEETNPPVAHGPA